MIGAASPSPAGSVSATVDHGFESLAARRDDWEDLFHSRFHEPSVSFEWTMAMARNHVRQGDRCFLITLSRGGAIAGFVPLVLREVPAFGMRVRILSPLSDEYNTHSDLLLRDAGTDLVRALLGAIRGLRPRWDLFRMARLLDDGVLADVLGQAVTGEGLAAGSRNGLPAYILDLPASFDAYLAARSAKFRNHLRRIERKIDAAGATVHEATTGGDLDAAFEALLSVERSSWKQAHGSAITAVQRQMGFYRALCEGAAAAGRLHLHWLTVGGIPVAYNLGYLQAGSYHYLKTSYGAEWRTLSPSTYLRARLIAAMIDRRIARFDFPGEPYEWETQWTDTVRWRRALSVYGATPRGLLLRAADRLRHRPQEARVVEHRDPRRGRVQTSP